MLRKIAIGLAAGALASTGAAAQDTAKIGLVLPLTGGLAPVGKQVQAGVKAYMDKHGSTVAGKKIDLIVKDDAGVPDNSKRLAQEFIVNDKVAVVGSALTPSAFAKPAASFFDRLSFSENFGSRRLPSRTKSSLI